MRRKTWLRATVMAGIASCLIGTSGVRPVRAHHDDGCPDVIVEAFGENAHAACQVSWCESRWDPNAWNGADAGLFQVNKVHGAHSTFDPERNVAFAYRLSDGGTRWGGTSRWYHCALRYGLP